VGGNIKLTDRIEKGLLMNNHEFKMLKQAAFLFFIRIICFRRRRVLCISLRKKDRGLETLGTFELVGE